MGRKSGSGPRGRDADVEGSVNATIRIPLIAATLGACAVAVGSPAVAQSARPPGSQSAVQVTGSVPDLSGAYMIRDFRGALENMAIDLKGGGIPFVPEEEKRYRAFAKVQLSQANPDLDQSPSARCLPPGLTFLMTAPYPMEIIQTPSKVLTLHEFGNYVRQIFLRTDHGDPDPTWLGHSIGRYEGDTLVVETIGFNAKAWLDVSGLRSSEALRTVERFRRTPSELQWTVTIEDKKMFTRPWTVQTHYRPLSSFDINEYVCLENNMLLGSPGMKEKPVK
jgi:hypothetical protein